MCDRLCDVISCDTGKINVYDKIVTENKKTRFNMEIKKFFIYKSPSKNGLEMEFTVELMYGVLTSFTICDAYRYFASQTLLLTSKSRSGTEYLIPTYYV